MTAQGPEALLQWCKTNTSGYPDVAVQNFHSSWRDGLALCALINKFHPGNLAFESLTKENPLDTLETAFAVAEKLGMWIFEFIFYIFYQLHFCWVILIIENVTGIPRLMDPPDMLIEPRPDQFSVMTYLNIFILTLTIDDTFFELSWLSFSNVSCVRKE